MNFGMPWTLVFVPWTGHEPRPHRAYANGDKLPATAEDIEVWKAFVAMQTRIDQLEAAAGEKAKGKKS